MAAPCFIMWNGATTVLTGALAPVNCSAVAGTVMTMQQIKPVGKIRIVEWGYRFKTSPAAPVQMELLETDVAATVTSASTTAIVPYNDSTGPGSTVSVGASASGYTASAEGTIAASRLLAATFDLATYFSQQFPLGREPEINAAKFLRVRATPSSSAAVPVLTYVVWEE